jgi:hypothetical protein
MSAEKPERHILVVYTNAVAGREAEFNDWYDNEHLADVLRIPCFVGARRYTLSPEKLDPEKPDFEYRYLAIYEIDGCSAREALDRLSEARKSMHLSEAMAAQRINMTFTPL